ncbi:MAG: mannose-1-phosphate guanylyltransferase/mannose-6-phosphate isomerase, partial [Spiribacter salinus]
MLLPVIMAGGSGSRLWPLSRQLNPKQFLALTGDATLFQSTLARLDGLTEGRHLVLCNEEHRFMAAEQLRQAGIDSVTLMLEPEGRNTAPAIALAALHATADGSDPDLLVLAADHAIQDTAAFHESVRA